MKILPTSEENNCLIYGGNKNDWNASVSSTPKGMPGLSNLDVNKLTCQGSSSCQESDQLTKSLNQLPKLRDKMMHSQQQKIPSQDIKEQSNRRKHQMSSLQLTSLNDSSSTLIRKQTRVLDSQLNLSSRLRESVISSVELNQDYTKNEDYNRRSALVRCPKDDKLHEIYCNSRLDRKYVLETSFSRMQYAQTKVSPPRSNLCTHELKHSKSVATQCINHQSEKCARDRLHYTVHKETINPIAYKANNVLLRAYSETSVRDVISDRNSIKFKRNSDQFLNRISVCCGNYLLSILSIAVLSMYILLADLTKHISSIYSSYHSYFSILCTPSKMLLKSVSAIRKQVTSISTVTPKVNTKRTKRNFSKAEKYFVRSRVSSTFVAFVLFSSLSVHRKFVGASEFPDRECCDSAPPPPPFYHTTSSTTPVPPGGVLVNQQNQYNHYQRAGGTTLAPVPAVGSGGVYTGRNTDGGGGGYYGGNTGAGQTGGGTYGSGTNTNNNINYNRIVIGGGDIGVDSTYGGGGNKFSDTVYSGVGVIAGPGGDRRNGFKVPPVSYEPIGGKCRIVGIQCFVVH